MINLNSLYLNFYGNEYFLRFKSILDAMCVVAKSHGSKSITEDIIKYWGYYSVVGLINMLGEYEVYEFLKGVCLRWNVDVYLWENYSNMYYEKYFK